MSLMDVMGTPGGLSNEHFILKEAPEKKYILLKPRSLHRWKCSANNFTGGKEVFFSESIGVSLLFTILVKRAEGHVQYLIKWKEHLMDTRVKEDGMEKENLAIRISGVKKEYRLGSIGGRTLHGRSSSLWVCKKYRGREDPNVKIGQDDIETAGRTKTLIGN